MPTEMHTVTTTADYTVAVSEHLIFTDQGGFRLSQAAPGSPAPHLRILGEVEVVMTSEAATGATGIGGISITNTWDGTPWVSIAAGGILRVTATGGSAMAYFGGGNTAAKFENAGVVVVTAEGNASGFLNWSPGGQLFNSGQLTVTSSTADALGVQTQARLIENSGTVIVSGRREVIGVDIGGAAGSVFHNTGTIVAHSTSTARPGVGVRWTNGPQPDNLGSFINDGTIEGDRALDVNIGWGQATENVIINNGRLIGEVWMGGGAAETLVNNGLIDGVVRLIGAGSIYDGRHGTALGTIFGSNNGGTTLLGGLGAETMVGGYWNDTISGGDGDDRIDGGRGADHLDGGRGANTLSFASLSWGVELNVAAGTSLSAGDVDTFTGFARFEGSRWSDTLSGGAGEDYLRGGDGDDVINGAAAFDDINGNVGNDTAYGGAGDDWVVGGKDNDLLYGDDGSDVVLGNLGADTLEGGNDLDILRGGQGDDIVRGGAGSDFVSGDRGKDTISGGPGKDFIHTFQDAGIDRVTDFSIAEGDRVMLDPGTTYTVSQVGADVVIDMGAGNQMILENVQLGALPTGWIFEAWVVPW